MGLPPVVTEGGAPGGHWLSQHCGPAGATGARPRPQASVLSPWRPEVQGRGVGGVGSFCGCEAGPAAGLSRLPAVAGTPGRPSCALTPSFLRVYPSHVLSSRKDAGRGIRVHTTARAARPSQLRPQRTAPSPNKGKGRGVGAPRINVGVTAQPLTCLFSPRDVAAAAPCTRRRCAPAAPCSKAEGRARRPDDRWRARRGAVAGAPFHVLYS